MFQNNKINLIISILLSIALWAYVFFEVNPTKNRTINDVPVQLTGLSDLQERDLTVANDEEFTVGVTIRGPRSEVAAVSVDNIEASADISSLTEGDNTINVKVTVPENVTKDDVKPSTVTITVEEYITASKHIEVNFQGDFADGTEPGFISSDPETTEVSGARSLVESVSHVEVTVSSGDVKNEEQTVEEDTVPVDSDGEKVPRVTVADETADVTSTLLYVKTVPLEVPITGQIDSDYQVTAQRIPDSVTIRGIKSRIDEISSLEAQRINISNIRETTEIPIEIDLPNQVELAEGSRNLIAVIEISGITVSDLMFNGTEINFQNVPDGYTVKTGNESIRVSVFGNESAIANLTKADITLYMDLADADFSQSTYTGTVRYSTDKSFSNVNISPARITVSISE